MLVLFDIDGTLLLSGGAGYQSMGAAGRELFGPDFTTDGVDYAGRLDPIIFRMLAEVNGIDDHLAHHDQFRATYRRELESRLGQTHHARALPGARDLVDACTAHDAIAMGIVTGNYEETGRMKVANAGYDVEAFRFSAWGSDGATRRDLPPHAIAKYESTHAGIDRSSVVVIGDTPHDIDCAHANGCRVIAVCTGPSHHADDLAGADLVVDDLTDTAALMSWITGTAGG